MAGYRILARGGRVGQPGARCAGSGGCVMRTNLTQRGEPPQLLQQLSRASEPFAAATQLRASVSVKSGLSHVWVEACGLGRASADRRLVMAWGRRPMQTKQCILTKHAADG
jgi:hypothetical protein